MITFSNDSVTDTEPTQMPINYQAHLLNPWLEL